MASGEEESKSPVVDQSSSVESDSEASGTDDEPSQVEWLATTREKRSTAGNRMKSMLANEEPDSDLELLFAEEDDDAGFTDIDEDGSDVQLGSSSDEEDEQNAGDELEGEKELEEKAKERRAVARKRKAQDAIPARFRKKVRIDAAAPAPAPRPKKKSERISWLPTAAEAPTRASKRHATQLSKAQLHEQMKEREAKRLRQVVITERKAKKLEAMKRPPMTQADRLTEAADVEKRNSKSLNRWEEAEKQREEERRAKLAALNNRTLKGPVITFWSGTGEWGDGRLAQSGKHLAVEEKPRKKRGTAAAEKGKSKGKGKGKTKELAEDLKGSVQAQGHAEDAADQPQHEHKSMDDKDKEQAGSSEILTPVSGGNMPLSQLQFQPPPVPQSNNPEPEPLLTGSTTPELHTPNTESKEPKITEIAASEELPKSISKVSGTSPRQPTLTPPLASLEEPAAMPPVPDPKAAPSVLAPPVLEPPLGANPGMLGDHLSPPRISAGPLTGSGILAPPNTTHRPTPLHIPSGTPPTAQSDPKPPGSPTPTSPRHLEATSSKDSSKEPSSGAAPSQLETSAAPNTTVTRNAIILQNFDENALKDKVLQTQILFGRKMSKVQKPGPQPLCAITNHPARYRDPKTGLPYFNAYAYREIQRLQRGDYKWSALLGAWVGNGKLAAQGVPKRFLGDASGTIAEPPSSADVDAGGEVEGTQQEVVEV